MIVPGLRCLVLVACAWILWSYSWPMRGEPERWTPREAFGTQAACDQARITQITQWQQAYLTSKPEVEVLNGRLQWRDTDGLLVSISEAKCFPDTIDPRPR